MTVRQGGGDTEREGGRKGACVRARACVRERGDQNRPVGRLAGPAARVPARVSTHTHTRPGRPAPRNPRPRRLASHGYRAGPNTRAVPGRAGPHLGEVESGDGLGRRRRLPPRRLRSKPPPALPASTCCGACAAASSAARCHPLATCRRPPAAAHRPRSVCRPRRLRLSHPARGRRERNKGGVRCGRGGGRVEGREGDGAAPRTKGWTAGGRAGCGNGVGPAHRGVGRVCRGQALPRAVAQRPCRRPASGAVRICTAGRAGRARAVRSGPALRLGSNAASNSSAASSLGRNGGQLRGLACPRRAAGRRAGRRRQHRDLAPSCLDRRAVLAVSQARTLPCQRGVIGRG